MGGTLPSWFYRIQKISYERDLDAEDFDKDLSELEEEGDDEDEHDSDDSVDSRHTQPDSDLESKYSYSGSDAPCYYKLKAEREERKREKHRRRDREYAKEEKVRAAYQSLLQAHEEHKRIPLEPLAGQRYYLYSLQHFDYFWHRGIYRDKTLSFSPPNDKKRKRSEKDDLVCGQIYLDPDSGCSLAPFRGPSHARPKTITLKTDYADDKYDLAFQFLGNGYLELSVPRDLFFNWSDRRRSLPPDAPKVFEFFGVRRDLEKERVKRKAMRKTNEARRLPSPIENDWY